VKTRQLAELGLGLLGVWALLYALMIFMSVASMALFQGGGAVGSVLLAEGVPTALLLGISYLLIFHNALVATAIFPDFETTSEKGSPDLDRILVAVVGVLLLGQAIPGSISALFNFFAMRGFPGESLRAQLIPRFLASGAQVAFALYLIVRPERLLAFLRRPRPD
jgi:hypothetical protein